MTSPGPRSPCSRPDTYCHHRICRRHRDCRWPGLLTGAPDALNPGAQHHLGLVPFDPALDLYLARNRRLASAASRGTAIVIDNAKPAASGPIMRPRLSPARRRTATRSCSNTGACTTMNHALVASCRWMTACKDFSRRSRCWPMCQHHDCASFSVPAATTSKS